MSLLTLKNIGKIYVSDNNVSVGIRGVNLSMDRGEFIAVTGKSGSGKSTLLNVLSGMDTYEEGELFVEGEPTSHYLQKDWEEYRKQYISFIFQDYNIMESFTVLQNVELALLHIENKVQRRKRAMELIRRVGLEKHIHHKGSKLSGGQKQRTVIARALAKDSPIILADEPTGNLDSHTSAEIIELLREVSKEKLVVVVTHNFDQVEAVATRHIRIFDGAVEADEVLVSTEPIKAKISQPVEKKSVFHNLLSGGTLGMARFRATPKLSTFLCILMLLTSIVITMVTSLNSDAKGLFDKNYMFTHINGRTVIVRSDGAAMTDAEVAELAQKVGASSFEHYDFMLDQTVRLQLEEERFNFSFGRVGQNIRPDAGRLPEKENEVLLVLPLSMKTKFGDGATFSEKQIPLMMNAIYTVTGVKYHVDNTLPAQLLFSETGYRTASALAFFENRKEYMNYEIGASAQPSGWNTSYQIYGANTIVDFDLPQDRWSVTGKVIDDMVKDAKKNAPGETPVFSLKILAAFNSYEYGRPEYGYAYDVAYPDIDYGSRQQITYPITGTLRTEEAPVIALTSQLAAQDPVFSELYTQYRQSSYIVFSPKTLCDFLYGTYYLESYTQASLFFGSDGAAHRKVAELRSLGYTAVVTDTTVAEEFTEAILGKIEKIFSLIGWLLTVVFATLFLNLCSSRAMAATQGDIAIMRSMGISTPVIRASIYIQTLIALIPTYLGTAIAFTVLYLTPVTNGFLPFLHFQDYLIIAIALLLINLNLSRKYVKKMFHESVKKTMRGGAKE